jgi:AcrR family transcriptional regulator
MLDQTSLKRGNRGHSRAGNAMERSRKALLDGARVAISVKGLSATSMVDVADYGQVARATLYNHFRSKDDLWTALIIDELERVSTLFRAEKTFEAGLMALAQAIGTNSMLRTIAATDPTTLARLIRTDQGPIWTRIEARFALLAKERKVSDSAAVNLAFRWLLSQVASPITPEFLPSATAMVARMVKLPAVLF